MVEIPSKVNIASWFVDRPAQQHPDRVAILCERRELCYRELAELTNRAGNALKAYGCRPGDRVLIALPDCIEFVATFFGTAKIGAIAVPVNPSSKTAEFAHYLEDSGARVVVADAAVLPQLAPALAGQPCRLIPVSRDASPEDAQHGWKALTAAAHPVLDPHPTAAEDPAFFLYTSGSTGLPKAAVHEHKSMLVTTQSFAKGVLDISCDDRILSVPKLFFAYGLGNGMYFPLAAGGSTILNSLKAELTNVVDLIARHRPTILFAVPTFLRALLQEAENGVALDLSSLRLVVYGGEPTPAGFFEQFKHRFGVEMLEGFGSTEMLQTFLSNRPGLARGGTCGVPVPNYEICLMAEDGQPVERGETGALWVKGKSAFKGYWNRPDLTSRVKAGDWVVTGDQFFQDADGYYHFCGRTDDMVKIAGMWASPQDVESVLSRHPAVAQAVVLPSDKEPGVKQLIAYVLGKNGAEPAVADLRRYLSGLVPEHMVPSAFFILRELPLTGSGKVDRRSLLKLSSETQPAVLQAENGRVAPRNPTETKIAQIWSALLNIPEPGVFDDFVDLGGNSVTGMQCLSRIHKAFGVEISLPVFLSDAATISRLAELVKTMCGERSLTR